MQHCVLLCQTVSAHALLHSAFGAVAGLVLGSRPRLLLFVQPLGLCSNSMRAAVPQLICGAAAAWACTMQLGSCIRTQPCSHTPSCCCRPCSSLAAVHICVVLLGVFVPVPDICGVLPLLDSLPPVGPETHTLGASGASLWSV